MSQSSQVFLYPYPVVDGWLWFDDTYEGFNWKYLNSNIMKPGWIKNKQLHTEVLKRTDSEYKLAWQTPPREGESSGRIQIHTWEGTNFKYDSSNLPISGLITSLSIAENEEEPLFKMTDTKILWLNLNNSRKSLMMGENPIDTAATKQLPGANTLTVIPNIYADRDPRGVLFSGNDKIEGSEFGDFFNAGGGDDILDGNAGNDFLQGGSGSDKINGGDGVDWIEAGDGVSDELTGGPKSDVFVFGPNQGYKDIFDFYGPDKVQGEIERLGGYVNANNRNYIDQLTANIDQLVFWAPFADENGVFTKKKTVHPGSHWKNQVTVKNDEFGTEISIPGTTIFLWDTEAQFKKFDAGYQIYAMDVPFSSADLDIDSLISAAPSRMNFSDRDPVKGHNTEEGVDVIIGSIRE